jgi:hypothetical protein
VADQHAFVLTVEASGDVTPAPPSAAQPDDEATQPEPEEAEE